MRRLARHRRIGRPVPAGGDLRLSDHAADAHRRGPRRNGEGRRPGKLRIHQRRIRVRRAVGGHRRLGGRCAHLHRHRQPGPALHGRGGVQRGGAGPAHRHDHRQPRHRRADQHLERPYRLHVDARRRLDPALCGNQPGGGRPAHPGLPPRRGTLHAGDGVRGRLHPHACLRAPRHPDAGTGGCLPAALRAAPGARSARAGLDRRHGRPGGLHGGALPRPPQADARARADPAAFGGIQGGVRARIGRPDAHLSRRGRQDHRRRARFGERHHQGRRRRAARRRLRHRRRGHPLLPPLPERRTARAAVARQAPGSDREVAGGGHRRHRLAQPAHGAVRHLAARLHGGGRAGRAPHHQIQPAQPVRTRPAR